MNTKRTTRFLMIFLLTALALGQTAGAQSMSRKEARAAEKAAKAAAKEARKLNKRDQRYGQQTQAAKPSGGLMPYFIENGDTVYYDAVPPVWIFGRSMLKKSDWKQYYRLVYNFNKAWPYASMCSRIVQEVDHDLETKGFSRIQKEKYINQWQKRLLADFEPIIRQMSISQGKLLCRLIDREIGKSSYDIVKDYKSGLAASVWQGVAKLFSGDLKAHYDPDGEDRPTEELIKMWERGEFETLYFSIFGKMPDKVVIPENYR
ncbi:MAG: DUF4294 domain-containing protein [Bacteroidales bacterium]|nr:DUF4294 domain-containing protein [Bacteroidales bacterium]